MSKLSNKGQSLAIFVIFVPFIIMIGAFIVDIGFAKHNTNKLNLLNQMVMRYGLKNIDEDPYNEMVDLIYQNDSKIDSYNIVIDESNKNIKIELNKATKGFFGTILKKDIYKQKSSYKGYFKEEKIIIERVL